MIFNPSINGGVSFFTEKEIMMDKSSQIIILLSLSYAY
jgi:hypothetical protein